MSATATQPSDRPAAAKLILPRPDALRHLKTAFDKGTEIKARRIRNGDDLDEGLHRQQGRLRPGGRPHRPDGSGSSATMPVCRYSAQAEPAR